MTINLRIKQLLEEKNKKQTELAAFLGVRQNTISDWITKEKFPSSSHVYRICDFFNISFNYLFTGEDDYKKSSQSDLTESEREMLKLVQPLSDKDKIKVIGIIENYLATRGAGISSPIQPMYFKEEQIEQIFKNSMKKPL